MSENPARIPPQTPPAGGKSAEAGRIQNPRQIVSPCRVRFNHLDFARNSFELCPTNTAKKKPERVFLFTEASKQTALLACEIRRPFPCECTHEWKRCTDPVRIEKRTRGLALSAGKIKYR